EREAELSGRLRHRATGEADLPAVGDWVAVRLSEGEGPALVQAVLPRRSRVARKVAGAVTSEQVVAANVDVVLVVAGLDGDYNPRRLERALVLAWEGGAQPVVVLNKADLVGDDALADLVQATEDIAPGVAVVPVSAATGAGLRELQLWAAPDALGGTFVDVETLAESCRYTDCRHAGEPGCAVLAAAEAGTLAAGRLESYRKLQRELRHLALRQDDLGRREEK